jgi:hypothetical protein
MTHSDIVEACANAGAVVGNLMLYYGDSNHYVGYSTQIERDAVVISVWVYDKQGTQQQVSKMITFIELLSADPVLVAERCVTMFDNELKRKEV